MVPSEINFMDEALLARGVLLFETSDPGIEEVWDGRSRLINTLCGFQGLSLTLENAAFW